MADPVVVTVVVPDLPVVTVVVPDLPVVTEVEVGGIQGPVGPGVPQGGATGQALVKTSATDFDTEWTSNLKADSILFDTAAGLEADTEGELVWDDDAGTLSVGINGGLKLYVGEELLIRVTNQTGDTLAKGSLLAYDGTIAQSGRLLAKKAVADGSESSRLILGVAPDAIPDGEDGYALQQGRVKPFNTTSTDWQQNDILWADPAVDGGLTRVEPAAPNLRYAVAVVVSTGSAGTLYVRMTPGVSLADDELVTLTNLQDGDTLLWDAAQGRFENGQPPTALVDSVNGQTGTVVLDATDVGALGTATTTDGIAEGTANLYYTDVRAAAAAPVQSVNGALGTVVLTTSDVAEGTALYYTDARAEAAAPVQSVNGGTGVVTITASGLGAYLDTNPAGYVDAVGAAAAAPVQSVNGAQGTVVLTTSDVAEGTALYYTDARASAAAPVQSVNGASGTVVLDYEDVDAIGTAVGLYVYDYGTAIPSTRPTALAVYWRGTAEPGTALAQAGDLWYDADGA